MRFRFRRKLFDPTSLMWFPGVVPWPSNDHVRISMHHIYECDQEFRGDASILLGKEGTPHECSFRVKAILDYSNFTAGTLGDDDPCNVLETWPLLVIDRQAATFTVPVIAPNLVGGGHHTHHHVSPPDQFFHTHLTRNHKHVHQHVQPTDQHFHYTAPQRTVINRNTLHQILSFSEFTTSMTNNRIFKSIRTVPNFLHTEFHLHSPPRHVHWGLISGKPDLDSLYASLGHHHDDRYYKKSEVDSLVANAGTAPDLSAYYTKLETDGTACTLLII